MSAEGSGVSNSNKINHQGTKDTKEDIKVKS